MFLTWDDFRIKSSNFDLTNEWNVLRIISGLFLFPHIAGKFVGVALSPAIVAFFAKAGFNPPELFVCLAALAEFAAAVTLVLGVCTRYAAFGSALLLFVAVYALQVTKGFGWTWNTGGYEYPVFWAIVSIMVGVHAWKTHLATQSHVPNAAPVIARA